ncbi:DNA modification methylase [Agromyces sp. CFH 90414]|uniref:DNA modification methylase n=1 Tax=Agromyces agglutinans TaxID=2662258 RepID=A0A6I2FEA6_9MICO|nr:DNA modification methylase [Agromyces agglutinans]MRG61030.1 DNA modification methylase [Agromyces agglutinans]
MKARLAASAALALGIVIGASGCSMVTYQATTEHYDASDGVSANVGDLELRNVLVLAESGADEASLVLTVANRGDSDADLSIEPVDGGEALELEVPAHGQVVVGAGEEEPLTLEGIEAEPGSLTSIYFVTSGAEGVEVQVPVLDGTLPEYEDLLP